MDLVPSVYRGKKAFAPFGESMSALGKLIKEDETLVKGQSRLFSGTFRAYAATQAESHAASLTAIADAGMQRVQIGHELTAALHGLPRELQPLQTQQAGMGKQRLASDRKLQDAERARKECAAAEAALDRARTSGGAEVAKREAAFAAAQRRGESMTGDANTRKEALERLEVSYRAQFIEAFVLPMVAAVDLRVTAAERLVALSETFREAVDSMVDFPDPALSEQDALLAELRQIVIE